MKHINKKAARVMRKLIKGLMHASQQKNIARSRFFLPVVIECIGQGRTGSTFCLAHYLVHQGDLISGPELEFLHAQDGCFYPIAINHASSDIKKEAVVWDDQGKIQGVYEKTQKELVKIANQWLVSIKYQQRL